MNEDTKRKLPDEFKKLLKDKEAGRRQAVFLAAIIFLTIFCVIASFIEKESGQENDSLVGLLIMLGVFVFMYCVVLIQAIRKKHRTRETMNQLSDGWIAVILDELKGEDTKHYESAGLCLTKQYLISGKCGLLVLKYSEIKNVEYKQVIRLKREVLTRLILETREGKKFIIVSDLIKYRKEDYLLGLDDLIMFQKELINKPASESQVSYPTGEAFYAAEGTEAEESEDSSQKEQELDEFIRFKNQQMLQKQEDKKVKKRKRIRSILSICGGALVVYTIIVLIINYRSTSMMENPKLFMPTATTQKYATATPYLLDEYFAENLDDSSKYLLAFSEDGYPYIIRISEEVYADCSELIRYMYEDIPYPGSITFNGVPDLIPEDVRDYAIEELNYLYGYDSVDEENFEDVVGVSMLDTTKKLLLADDLILYAIMVIVILVASFFGRLLWFHLMNNFTSSLKKKKML